MRRRDPRHRDRARDQARAQGTVSSRWIPRLLAMLLLVAPIQVQADAVAGAASAQSAAASPDASPDVASSPSATDRIAAHALLVEQIERALAEGAIRPGLELTTKALELARAIGDPLRIGVTQSLHAQLLAAMGDLEEANAEYARAGRSLAGAPALAAANRLNQANLAARLGRFDEAMAAYREVAEGATERGDDELAARALVNAWRARVEAGPGDLSPHELQKATQALDAVERPELRASLAIHLARSLELARETPAGRQPAWALEASRLLNGALADADAARSAGLRAEALGTLGSLYESERHLEEAASLTDRALAQGRRSESVAPGARWQLQAGRLRRDLGELDVALAHYSEAVAIVGRPRDAGGGAVRASRPGGRSAFESEDAEAYRVAELKDYFADDCVDRDRASRARVDDAPGSFVVLYPVILEDRLELLVSRRDWIESRTVAIKRSDLEKLARQYRGLLEDRTTRLYLRPAQALYAALIAPIEDLLEKQAPETIVVVPDGVLRTIPFAALHDGKRHLIERYALATTPSLELSDPHPFDRTKVGSLYGGLTTSVQGFDALPQVKQELETANHYLPGTMLLDESFSRKALIDQLSTRNFDLVHVASHAEFSSADKGGFLLTHDGKLRLDEFRRAVELLQYRDRPLEILILSACETAAGDDRAALGFSGAAVQAGARSVLGSLWLVQDEATGVLLETFYEGLANPAFSRAKAMQRAQLRLIGDPAYAHPSSWAAFLLINSWL